MSFHSKNSDLSIKPQHLFSFLWVFFSWRTKCLCTELLQPSSLYLRCLSPGPVPDSCMNVQTIGTSVWHYFFFSHCTGLANLVFTKGDFIFFLIIENICFIDKKKSKLPNNRYALFFFYLTDVTLLSVYNI